MSRASDYVIALRTSASGSSSKAASNSYVTIVKNSILANTNSYIATVNTLAGTYKDCIWPDPAKVVIE